MKISFSVLVLASFSSLTVLNLIFLWREYWPLHKSFTLIHFYCHNFRRRWIIQQFRFLKAFYFYNTCLNLFNDSSLFSGGITVSSKFLIYLSFTCFILLIVVLYDLTPASVILFLINSPVAWAVSWTAFFKSAFKAPSPVSINCVLYLLDIFFANGKISYLLTYFLAGCSVKQCVISIYW